MRTLLTALCLWLVAASALPAWELVSTERLVADSDIVLIGKLAYIMRGEPGPRAVDTGYIEGAELLKGTLPDGHGVVLTFPGRRGTFSDGKFVSTLTERDLRFEEGLEACWFLKRVPGTDAYAVDHPSRVQPYPYYDEIRAKIYAGAQAEAAKPKPAVSRREPSGRKH